MSMARIPTLAGREEAMEENFPSLSFGPCLDAEKVWESSVVESESCGIWNAKCKCVCQIQEELCCVCVFPTNTPFLAEILMGV